jgi:hypothetical protein
MMQLAALLAALALAQQAPQTEAFETEVHELRDAVASPMVPDANIYDEARDLFETMPRTKINVAVNLRGWDKETDIKGGKADVSRLFTSARKKLSDLNTPTPPSGLKSALDYADGLRVSGKIAEDAGLKDNQMGAYEWIKTALGDIKLNTSLNFIAGQIGDVLAFATLAHEAGHARDHQEGKLDGKNVIDGEISAFRTQYQWLKLVDPHGERVAWLRAVMMQRQREAPSRLNETTLAYLLHLAKLHDTEGDTEKLRSFVHEMGYEDDHGHDRGAHPASA